MSVKKSVLRTSCLLGGRTTNHQFDGEGRLVSYNYITDTVTITWK
jgi:hypothetical protein